MKYRIFVSLRKGILDPESEAIKKTINNIGFNSVEKISKGKYFDIEFDKNEKKSKHLIDSISKDILSNPVIENFEIKIIK